MANRSYLYNLDFNRSERAKTKEDKVLGVSEYAYEIPLSYKILLSVNPKNTNSILWDYEHPIAVTGDANAGKRKLLKFLDELVSKEIFDSKDIQDQINTTKQFFNENNYNLKYFFLEGGELYQMDDTPFENQNLDIYEQIKNIDKTIEIFFDKITELNQEIEQLEIKRNNMTKKSWFKKQKYVLSEIERSKVEKEVQNKNVLKQELLGIDNWSKILYFHFGE